MPNFFGELPTSKLAFYERRLCRHAGSTFLIFCLAPNCTGPLRGFLLQQPPAQIGLDSDQRLFASADDSTWRSRLKDGKAVSLG